jgi:hypothetical protein
VGEEIEVRREDQDKINKFSRLHQRELAYEEELKVKSVSCPFAFSALSRNLPLTTFAHRRKNEKS